MACETLAVQTLTVQQIGEIIQTACEHGVEELEIVDERPGNPRLLLYFRRGYPRQEDAAGCFSAFKLHFFSNFIQEKDYPRCQSNI